MRSNQLRALQGGFGTTLEYGG